jgi:hypothetical protein
MPMASCYATWVPLADHQRLTCSTDVLARVLDGEAVLLDLASGEYFGLNAVGTRVWELLSAGNSYGEVRAALVGEFEAPAATIDRDLDELVGRLLERKLVRLADAAGGGA